jgi:hypothetical protein
MESYNAYIARKQLGDVDEMIDNIPQPTMFGGKRFRQFVLPGNNDYTYPSSLAVEGSAGNTMADEYVKREPLGSDPSTWTPKHLQGGAVMDYVKPVFDYASPIIQNAIKEAVVKAMQGKLCPKNGSGMSGGFGWGDIAGPLQDIGREIAPIAKDVAVDMIKDSLKGKGRRGRPKKGGDLFDDMAKPFNAGYNFGYNTLGPAIFGSGHKKHSKKGGFGWGDIAGPIQDIGREIAPIAKDVAVDMIKDSLKGKGRRGRPKKGGFGWGDIAGPLKDIGRELAPVAKEVAVDMIKDTIKGKGRRGRPKKGGDIIGPWLKKQMESISEPYEKIVGINPFNAGYDFGYNYLGPAIDKHLSNKKGKGHSKKGGFGWGDIESGFHAVDNITRPIAKELLPIAVKAAMGAGRRGRPKKGGAVYPNPAYAQHAKYPAYPPNMNRNMLYHTQDVVKGAGRKTRKPSARNEIVKKVMREKGLSLPQASKFVKEHGLY